MKPQQVQNDAESHVNLPALLVDQCEKLYYCLKCQHQAVPSGRFLLCESCKAKSLLSSSNSKYQVRATFQLPSERITLVIPHQKIMELVEGFKLDQDDADEIEYVLLDKTNAHVKLQYSERTRIVLAVHFGKSLEN